MIHILFYEGLFLKFKGLEFFQIKEIQLLIGLIKIFQASNDQDLIF